MKLPKASAIVAASALLAGCGYLGTAKTFDASDLRHEEGWVAVRGVTEIRQASTTDCGAAALAMVFSWWGVREDLSDVLAACPPGPEGIKAAALRAHAKAKGLSAYAFEGKTEDLERELKRGRPLIVGMVKPYALTGGATHYEVVVAWHPEKKVVVTLDPAAGWRQNGLDGFLREWDPAGRLVLLVFRDPDDGPVHARSSSP
ncbi:MAG TPA: cysteine peptidase family C39 domain-containing protein [Planctomycetota bacterium]|nr:cysteine peptidase family C39 domain-containing protein [Planctomycetota bacterium]